jgi:hypothetical protein
MHQVYWGFKMNQNSFHWNIILGIGLFAVTTHVSANTCPCDYAGSVSEIPLVGAEMHCSTTNQGDDGHLPDGLQNQFYSIIKDDKKYVKKTVRMGLYEQGLLAGYVMSPMCFVQEVSDKKPRTLAAEYILTADDYTNCAEDLTLFVKNMIVQAENAGSTNCIDAKGIQGVMDVWERASGLSPRLPATCFDGSGQQIPCP